MAPVPTFIDGFKYNFTKMFGMIISQASLTFRVLGSRSRSLLLFLEKFVNSLMPTFINGL